MITSICVAGAGTMGSGIALCAAQHGFAVILFDKHEAIMEKARLSNQKILDSLVMKGKMEAPTAQAISERIVYTTDLQHCKADLIIEAIIEKMEAKVDLFKQFAVINEASTIFASNTSSLSIDALQEKLSHPERVAGMHFSIRHT